MGKYGVSGDTENKRGRRAKSSGVVADGSEPRLCLEPEKLTNWLKKKKNPAMSRLKGRVRNGGRQTMPVERKPGEQASERTAPHGESEGRGALRPGETGRGGTGREQRLLMPLGPRGPQPKAEPGCSATQCNATGSLAQPGTPRSHAGAQMASRGCSAD